MQYLKFPLAEGVCLIPLYGYIIRMENSLFNQHIGLRNRF